MIVQFSTSYGAEVYVGVNPAAVSEVATVWYYDGPPRDDIAEIRMLNGEKYEVRGSPAEVIAQLNAVTESPPAAGRGP